MGNPNLKTFSQLTDSENKKSIEPLADWLQNQCSLSIGMLNNPLSGGNRKRLARICKLAAKYPHVVQRQVQTPADVSAALADFARRKTGVIAVNAGDGTIQAVLTALFNDQQFEQMPLLALLRSAGTTSMIAGDVGLKGPRKKALTQLFDWAETKKGAAKILRRPVLKVQESTKDDPVYGMFFGTAGIYQATRYRFEMRHAKDLRGELIDGMVLARFLLAVALRDLKVVSPVPITISLDQNPPVHQKHLLAFVTTLERLFLGLLPFWGSESKPLHFTAIGSHPLHFLRVAPSLLRGRRIPHMIPANGYVSHNVDKVQLELDSGFNLDGQLHHPKSQTRQVTVTNGGQASFLQL